MLIGQQLTIHSETPHCEKLLLRMNYFNVAGPNYFGSVSFNGSQLIRFMNVYNRAVNKPIIYHFALEYM